MSLKDNPLGFDTVRLSDDGRRVIIIDQTLLPGELKEISLSSKDEIYEAIYLLKVRGAPAIGVAAAYGIYVLADQIDTQSYDEFIKQFKEDKEYLNSSRPTAVNLSWALERMYKVCTDNHAKPVDEIKKLLKDEACKIQEEDIEISKKIGEYGLELVNKGDGILTHCNAGQLATSRYGTATAPIYLGYEKGYDFKVYADETRPLLQGARLTAWELNRAGVDVTLLCDNMSAALMKEGRVNAVFVGCDRVAANGDVANKIGTSVVATVAARYNIPFYVCAPTSTIDMNTSCGDDIEIELRPQSEVTQMWYKKRMAPDNIKVYNPAFDVTDNELVSAIITEKGIARAPYDISLREIMK